LVFSSAVNPFIKKYATGIFQCEFNATIEGLAATTR